MVEELTTEEVRLRWAMRPVLMSLQGPVATRAWLGTLATSMAAAGAIPVALNPVLTGIGASASERSIARLREEIRGIRRRHASAPLSLVTQGTGGDLVAAVLESTPDVVLETLILCASAIRRDFPWSRLLDDYQVGVVFNCADRERSWRDWHSANRGTGGSGKSVFEDHHFALLQDAWPEYSHDDLLDPLHFEQLWLPALSCPLRRLIEEARQLTDCVRNQLRSNPAVSGYQVRTRLLARYPARSDVYVTLPGTCVADAGVEFTPAELGLNLSRAQAGSSPWLLPPALTAIAGIAPALWISDGRRPHRGHPDLAVAIGVPIPDPRIQRLPLGLLCLEVLGAQVNKAKQSVLEATAIAARRAAVASARVIAAHLRFAPDFARY